MVYTRHFERLDTAASAAVQATRAIAGSESSDSSPDDYSPHDYDKETADLTGKFEQLLSKVDAMEEKVTIASLQSSMLSNLDTRLKTCEHEMSLRPTPKHKSKRWTHP